MKKLKLKKGESLLASTGCDMQGDAVVYIQLIKANGEVSRYLSEAELERIVDHLDKWFDEERIAA